MISPKPERILNLSEKLRRLSDEQLSKIESLVENTLDRNSKMSISTENVMMTTYTKTPISLSDHIERIYKTESFSIRKTLLDVGMTDCYGVIQWSELDSANICILHISFCKKGILDGRVDITEYGMSIQWADVINKKINQFHSKNLDDINSQLVSISKYKQSNTKT